MSPKTKAKRDAQAIYRVWLKDLAGCCMDCGKVGTPNELELHEIPAGSHRDAALKVLPWVSLVLCPECHRKWQSTAIAPQVGLLRAWIVRCVNQSFGKRVVD